VSIKRAKRLMMVIDVSQVTTIRSSGRTSRREISMRRLLAGMAMTALLAGAAACSSSGGSGGATTAGGVDQVKVGADYGGVAVAKDSPIRTAADLAGKKISVNTLKNIGDKLIASRPDLVRRFTAAMTESLAYADAHPDEVRAVLASYTKIDAPTAKALTLPKWPAEINHASVETLAQLGAQDGIFTGTPDLAKLLP
jgi:ABC-type nitrate/sulfonate/bicarbonate transport system substrate-binding protein